MNDAARATPASGWDALALQPGGRSLIEASAGTGKTWTISLLYLRALLEQDLSPTQIIVTTFTDAAAQELRERVRGRLLWAERLAITECAADGDEGAAWLQARWRGDGSGRDTARARTDLTRLRLAQAELDRAPIGTLHALCRRVLADYPFESGGTFALAAPTLPDAINAELCTDLWRRLGEAPGALDPLDAAWWREGRDSLERHVRAALAPGVGVAAIPLPDLAGLMRPANARTLGAFAADAEPFKRPHECSLRRTLAELAAFIEHGDPAAPPPPHLREVFESPLDKYLKPDALPRAERCAAIAIGREAAAVMPALADALRSQALARYRTQLRARRRELLVARGALTFDELIERVHEALGAGGALADALFAAWPLALVDEFQDTDALQYAILDRIYRDGAGAPRGRLVMIGDPKQAIYRFRGGDIAAYLAARATATSTLALAVNYRASRQLVAGLNAFYGRAGGTLSSDPAHEIAYADVRPGARGDAEPYLIDGFLCERPLQVHYWDGADAPDDQDGRVAAALEACANQVVELLSGRHAIGAQAVQPGDIAVLLPTGAQIARLRALLRTRGVPCVTSAWTSVFATDWARELQVVLYAALHPRDDGAVRAALATRLFGRTWDDLRALAQRPDAWQAESADFEAFDALWQAQGVLALVREIAARAGPRLVAGDDGERTLTDLRHLGELLQARSEEIAGREELLAWLADERRRARSEGGDAAADERQQRIETDAARVRLLTLHASKGLEFPIVLLPLMWTSRHNARQDRIAVVHDAVSGQRVVAFDAAAQARYVADGQDERYRLLYVALTRARHACHVYALAPDRAAPGNARRADADPVRAPLDAMIERVLRHAEAPATMPHVAWKTGRWDWPYAEYRPAVAAPRATRRALVAPPAPPFEATWSFSALAQGAQAASLEEQPATDETPAVAEESADAAPPEPEATAPDGPEHPQLAWLAPVAGADFGNAVHAMFERRVPGVPMRAQHALVRRCLLEHGVGLRGVRLDELVPHLAARVQSTLDAPLLAGEPGLTLGALPAHALCAEMPFEFALGEVSLARLRAACGFVPESPLRALRGLMSGKIDLVFEHRGRFHVLDYKSNRLGSATRLSDYAPAQLERAMDDDHYRFQALLYTVALDRYLRRRIAGYRRGAQLGAAIYLFVRAVGIAPDTAPRAGIWTQRFDDALIDAVDAALAGDGRRAA